MGKDIISKLKLYIEQSEKHDIQNTDMQQSDVRNKYEIDTIIHGNEWRNGNDTCFIIENLFPLSYLYGGYALSEALNITKESLERICSINSQHLDFKISDLLFLDTETTGLSGGTGTVAFLIGVGFFTDEAFVVRQYFMRDYNEENAVLEALSELMTSYKGLITFNGKSFDWNLLQTRYIFNRLPIPLKQIIHLDLLHPARRIWKLKLESCALSSLEENILSEFRVDDIEGAMIPSVYFKYIVDRDAREIKKVIKHNEQDVLSMVALLSKMNELLEDPFENTECEYELFGLSKIFEFSGESQNYIDCMEKCIQSDNIFVKETALKKLTQLYKKNGDYERAVEYWKQMMERSENYNLFPLIELAKYYEHKEKNIEKALEITEKAVAITYKMGISNNTCKDDLKKRLNRLKAKLENKNKNIENCDESKARYNKKKGR